MHYIATTCLYISITSNHVIYLYSTCVHDDFGYISPEEMYILVGEVKGATYLCEVGRVVSGVSVIVWG